MSNKSFRGKGSDAVRRAARDSWQPHNLALEEEPEIQRPEPKQFYLVRRSTITSDELAGLHSEAQAKLDAQRAIKLMLRMMADEEGDTVENYQRNADMIRGVFERLGYSFTDARHFVHVALVETGVVLTKRRHVELMLAVIPREYSTDDIVETVRKVGVPKLRLLPDFAVELDEDLISVAERSGDEAVNHDLLKLTHDAERYRAAAANGRDFLVNWELWQALDVRLPEIVPAEEGCLHFFEEEEFNALDSDEAVEAYCQQLLQGCLQA